MKVNQPTEDDSPDSASKQGYNVLDDAPVTRFHRRLAAYSAGGPFLDGYVIGVIGVALIQLAPRWGLSGFWDGLLGAGIIVGLFIGGLAGGYLTDLVGRQVMYTVDLLLIAVLSGLQFFVEGPVWLLVLRILIGVAVGADYPIAASLLAEFSPRKHRGRLVGFGTVMWSAGNAVAYVIGGAMLNLGPEAWRWILVSPMPLALLLAAFRHGTPESPRWLVSKGKLNEANAVVRKVFGPHASVDNLWTGEVQRTSILTLVRGRYLRNTLFVMIFWTASVTPVYAIYAFAPALLSAFGLNNSDSTIGSAVIGLLFFIGAVGAALVADRFGRRPLLIVSFSVATAGLILLGLFPSAPMFVIVALFAVYALFIGGPTILQWIYPTELFPTEVRATAMGVGVAASRIGAAVGTFLVPVLLTSVGIGLTMLFAGGLSLLGVLASVFMAPETRHQRLHSLPVPANTNI